MRAGLLRHRIDIQEDQGTARDVEGEPVESWVTVEARVPAEQVEGGGDEGLSANQVHATDSVVMRVRYRRGRAYGATATRRPAMRFLWDDQVYDIQSITADPRREAHLIRAVRRDA